MQTEPNTLDLGYSTLGVALNKLKRTICKPVWFGIDGTISYVLISSNGDLEGYEETMESSNRESWM